MPSDLRSSGLAGRPGQERSEARGRPPGGGVECGLASEYRWELHGIAENKKGRIESMKVWAELTGAEQFLAKAMFPLTRCGYAAYVYEVTKSGWVISRKRKGRRA
jgi:hypothetical protein